MEVADGFSQLAPGTIASNCIPKRFARDKTVAIVIAPIGRMAQQKQPIVYSPAFLP